jgi:hypothetical protein
MPFVAGTLIAALMDIAPKGSALLDVVSPHELSMPLKITKEQA